MCVRVCVRGKCTNTRARFYLCDRVNDRTAEIPEILGHRRAPPPPNAANTSNFTPNGPRARFGFDCVLTDYKAITADRARARENKEGPGLSADEYAICSRPVITQKLRAGVSY